MSKFQNEFELIIPKGCDNAPRKQILIEFTVARLKKDHEIIEKYTHEAIVWYPVRENEKVEGQLSFLAALQDEYEHTITGLEVYQVITHGKFASINGVIALTNGNQIDFCDVYTFSSAAKSGKIKEMRSYRAGYLE